MNKQRAKPRHIEDDHQAALFRWIDMMAVNNDHFRTIFAVPNGGNRDAREAGRMKAQGVRAGVPDIMVMFVHKGYSGMAIELKKPIVPGESKPVASPEQKEWLKRLTLGGYCACLCFGWEQAQAALRAYFAGDPVPHRWGAP